MGSFIHFEVIEQLQAIQKLEGKYCRFYRIYIFQILTEYVTLICLYQVWRHSDRNYDFYQVFKALKESISTFIESTLLKF